MTKSIMQFLLFLFIGMQLFSCLTAGTHGSFKTYDFPVPKKILQKAAEKIISESADIHIDTTNYYLINITEGRNDTIVNNSYKDSDNYVTIKIQTSLNGNETIEYVIQYVGTKIDWDTSAFSTLSLVYAYDENGNGGSNVSNSLNLASRKKFLKLFETKFIDRLKKELEGK